MNPSFSRNKNVVPYHPLVYFLVFLIVNSFLSYFELTPAFKFWFLLIGIVLPISLALWNHRPSSDIQQFLYRSDFLPIVPLWVWATIALVAIMIRFYKLTTLSLWPHFDEAYINYYGFQLSRHWDDRLLYGSGQSTPLFMWLLAGFYKLIPPSLFSLWLFPALISMLTIPMAYVACRRFFSKSFSFLFLCLIALSFWGFYVGRFSFQYVLVLFWEFLVFYLWGGFKDKFPSKNHRELLLLAITMGLGFYVHLPAWSVFFLLWSSVIFIASTRKDHPFKIWSFLILYGGTIALVVSPLLWTAYRQGYGNYIRDLWAFSSRTPVPQQSNLIVNYFSCLFWGPNEFNAYGPFWGGFLNPILDSLFLLGILEILGNFKDWVYRCLLVVFLSLLIPAFLTNTLEPFRLLSLLPVVLAVTCLGLARLYLSFSPIQPMFLLPLLLILSFGLDFYHLGDRYPQGWESTSHWKSCSKSQSHYQSYLVLKRMAEDKGPGLIFSDFVPGNFDMSLFLADYEFNAVDNPDLSFSRARWAAVLTNANFKPFLEKRFPDGKAYFVSKGEDLSNGGWMLWVVPVTPPRLDIFRRWQKADLALGPYIDHYLSFVHGQPYTPVFNSHLETYHDFQGDPFLETLFWEKTADDFMKMGPSFHPQAISALLTATQKGYASAHLFYLIGTLYFVDQNSQGAQWAFRQALKAPIDLTASRQSLSWVPSKLEAR